MSTFNTFAKESTATLNRAGGEAFVLTPELELYTAVVTASLSNKFYETASERIDRIASLVGRCDAYFVAQLAVYARQKMNLRSVPLLLVVELAKVHSGDDLVSRTVEKVVVRVDEIMELLSCYQWRNKNNVSGTGDNAPKKKLGKLSHQIQAGLQRAFNKFDEYQFAKYDRDGLEVKLRDALFLVHPKAKDETQQALFDKIVNKTLETPYTWETELSALGQKVFGSEAVKKYAFAVKWEELIESGKLGYMAMLRNLRNFLLFDISRDKIKDVADRLSDEYEVYRSKQFPFRFLSAYKELKPIANGKTPILLDALEKAVLASAQNIDGFDENSRVLIACDVSGSMRSPISRNSSVENYDVGLVLAMLLKNRCENVVSGLFGDTWKVINLPSSGILSNVDALYAQAGSVGYSTNGFKVVEYLRTNNIIMDKVMMFTDCQMWNSYGTGQTIRKEWDEYKKIAPNAKLYLFDLAGYGAAPLDIVREDVYLIAGWSDRIFEILTAIENGSCAIEDIKKIEI